MIESIALIFANTGGTLGLLLFGFFGFAFLVVLALIYLCLKILASIHDSKELAFKHGKYECRRKSNFRSQYKYGLITSIVRWMRKVND